MTKLTAETVQTDPMNDPFHKKHVADLETRALIAYGVYFPNTQQPVALNAGERHCLGELVDRYGDRTADIIEIVFQHWSSFARRIVDFSTEGDRPRVANIPLIHRYREVTEAVCTELGGIRFKRVIREADLRLDPAPEIRGTSAEGDEIFERLPGESDHEFRQRYDEFMRTQAKLTTEAINKGIRDARDQQDGQVRAISSDANRESWERTRRAQERGNTRRDEQGNLIPYSR